MYYLHRRYRRRPVLLVLLARWRRPLVALSSWRASLLVPEYWCPVKNQSVLWFITLPDTGTETDTDTDRMEWNPWETVLASASVQWEHFNTILNKTHLYLSLQIPFSLTHIEVHLAYLHYQIQTSTLISHVIIKCVQNILLSYSSPFYWDGNRNWKLNRSRNRQCNPALSFLTEYASFRSVKFSHSRHLVLIDKVPCETKRIYGYIFVTKTWNTKFNSLPIFPLILYCMRANRISVELVHNSLSLINGQKLSLIAAMQPEEITARI